MPIELEKYLELTGKLANPEISVAERTQIVMELTEDYKTVHDDFKKLNDERDTLKSQVADITQGHSILMQKLGMTVTETEEVMKEKELSETITLEDLEKGMV